MSKLFPADIEALGRLSETGGFTAGDVAFFIHGERSRSHSAIMGRTMRGLELKGLVAKLDDQKPVCWVRTPAGTEAWHRKTAPSPTPAIEGA